jgi:hypothetical protein
MNQEEAMEVLPEARLCHASPGRLRIRIRQKRGDGAFFQRVKEALAAHFGSAAVAVNPVTASLLVEGASVSPAEVAAFAREAGLCALDLTPGPRREGVQNIISPLRTADARLRQISNGTLDVPSGVFVALVVYGVVEILRGNFQAPPWYTAFWYAFGVFTKTLVDGTKA